MVVCGGLQLHGQSAEPLLGVKSARTCEDKVSRDRTTRIDVQRRGLRFHCQSAGPLLGMQSARTCEDKVSKARTIQDEFITSQDMVVCGGLQLHGQSAGPLLGVHSARTCEDTSRDTSREQGGRSQGRGDLEVPPEWNKVPDLMMEEEDVLLETT